VGRTVATRAEARGELRCMGRRISESHVQEGSHSNLTIYRFRSRLIRYVGRHCRTARCHSTVGVREAKKEAVTDLSPR